MVAAMSTRLLLVALAASLALACASPAKPVAPVGPAPPAPVAAAPPPAAPATVKRTIVSLGRTSGTSTITTAPDGTITTVLDVLENGRGPHVDATITLAADGTIATLTARGHHTFGATFDATFTRTADHASWKSTGETAERDTTGPAFYVPIAEIPEVQGWLVSAALNHGGTLPLLPGGTAHVEKTGDVTLTAKGAPGKLADLIVVDGDPLAHISDLARTVTTMRGGIVFATAPVYAALGIEPAASQ